MLAAVVPERIPPEIEPAALLERLTHELAIVESLDEAGTADPAAGGLRLRPEVRSAVLRLLTVADPERVVTIDRRAADWWATRATGDPAEAAELVYHRLRLGEVAAAAAAWRAGCADRLLTAADDLADPAARAWLLARLRDDATDTELTNWEWNASRRIYHSSLRGLQRTITRVLDERPERTAASPLLVLDAWRRWQGGDPAGAAALLDAAGPAAGQIARDRTLVRAGLAAAAGDRDTAERLLAGISARTLWAEPVEATAVLAARVRLTVDLEGELELGRLPAGLWTGRIFAGGLDRAHPPAGRAGRRDAADARPARRGAQHLRGAAHTVRPRGDGAASPRKCTGCAAGCANGGRTSPPPVWTDLPRPSSNLARRAR